MPSRISPRWTVRSHHSPLRISRDGTRSSLTTLQGSSGRLPTIFSHPRNPRSRSRLGSSRSVLLGLTLSPKIGPGFRTLSRVPCPGPLDSRDTRVPSEFRPRRSLESFRCSSRYPTLQTQSLRRQTTLSVGEVPHLLFLTVVDGGRLVTDWETCVASKTCSSLPSRPYPDYSFWNIVVPTPLGRPSRRGNPNFSSYQNRVKSRPQTFSLSEWVPVGRPSVASVLVYGLVYHGGVGDHRRGYCCVLTLTTKKRVCTRRRKDSWVHGTRRDASCKRTVYRPLNRTLVMIIKIETSRRLYELEYIASGED